MIVAQRQKKIHAPRDLPQTLRRFLAAFIPVMKLKGDARNAIGISKSSTNPIQGKVAFYALYTWIIYIIRILARTHEHVGIYQMAFRCTFRDAPYSEPP